MFLSDDWVPVGDSGGTRTLTLCVDNLVLTLMVSHYQLHEGVF